MEYITVPKATKLYRRLSALLLIAFVSLLLPACGVSESGNSAKVQPKQNIQIKAEIDDYDGSIARENLKLALVLGRPEAESIAAKAEDFSSAADEKTLPFYSEAERKELAEQSELEAAASDYEEEPIADDTDAQDDGEAAAADSEDLHDECGDGCEHEEAVESAEEDASLDIEAEPEITVEAESADFDEAEDESTEAQEAASLEAEAVPEAEAEFAVSENADEVSEIAETSNAASHEVGAAEERLCGELICGELRIDERNVIHTSFEAEISEDQPLNIAAVKVYDVSRSDSYPVLIYPLPIVIKSDLASVHLNWAQMLAEKANGTENYEMQAKVLADGGITRDITIKITDIGSKPQKVIVNYYTDSDNLIVKRESKNFTFSSSAKTLTIPLSVPVSSQSDWVYIQSVNIDNSTKKPYGHSYLKSLYSETYYELPYSSFVQNAFTISSNIIVNNVPAKPAVNQTSYYVKSYSDGLDGGTQNAGLSISYDSSAQTAVLHMNVQVKAEIDDFYVTKLLLDDGVWNGKRSYLLSSNNSLKFDYSDFSFGEFKLTGTLDLTNLSSAPESVIATFATTNNQVKKTVSLPFEYDSDSNKAVAYIDLGAENVRGHNWLTLYSIKAGNKLWNGSVYFYSSLLSDGSYTCAAKTVDFGDLQNQSSGQTGNKKAVYVRISNVSEDFDDTNFVVKYAEGGNSAVAEKRLGSYSYQKKLFTFAKIMTDEAYITVKEIQFNGCCDKTARRIECSGDAALYILSYEDLESAATTAYEAVITGLTREPSYKKLYYKPEGSNTVLTTQSCTFSGTTLTFTVPSLAASMDIRKIELDNRVYETYKTLSRNTHVYQLAYDNMRISRNITYKQSVTGVTSEPASARLFYVRKKKSLPYDSTVYSVGGTYNSAAQTVNFSFSDPEDVYIVKIVINSKLYSKGIDLSYANTTGSIKYANLFTTRLVVKNVKKPANYIAIVYELYNSETGALSKKYKKTAGTYSSDAQTYTFNFTPALLNGEDYDSVRIASVALDNSVSTALRVINMGKHYNLLYSGLKAQSTRYSVNVANGLANVVGRQGTMTYTLPSGTSYTAEGKVRYDYAGRRFVMHFETVKTIASSIKVNKITVGNRYYASSFTMKYGQNKTPSNPNEGRNTRRLGMGSGFKACSVAYTVTLTNAASSLTNTALKWSTASGSYTTKGKYADGKVTFTMKTSADKLTVGAITAGSKKSIKTFTLTPKKRSYSINYSSQMGKKGNKWVSQTCTACWDYYGSGMCKACEGTGLVKCTAAKMPGGSKCFYCNDTGFRGCQTCAGSGICQTCSGKGKRNVLKAVN